MEGERSVVDLIETGKSSVLFDEIDFQLQILLRFSDCFQSGREKRKRMLSHSSEGGGEFKLLPSLRLEISSCLKVIDLCKSSIGTVLELSVKQRQLILEEVIAPCLFYSIDLATVATNLVSTNSSSLQCLQVCLLCTVLLLSSRKEESEISRSSSSEYIFDARIKMSTPLLLLICSYRPPPQLEAGNVSKSNTNLNKDIFNLTSIHKKRKKSTSSQPKTTAIDIYCDDDNDTKIRATPTISDVLLHFGVSINATVRGQLVQQQQYECSLYELMTMLLISRLLSAKINTWALVDFGHAQASTVENSPNAACEVTHNIQEESLAFVHSLLRTSIDISDPNCAVENSYLKLLCDRYFQDNSIQNFTLQTTNSRQITLLALSIYEMACYQCAENQDFIGSLQTNSELISTVGDGSTTSCLLLHSLCSMIYSVSERIASLASLCLALSQSHDGIVNEELLLASLRMVVACSNISNYNCSEILHFELPSSLSMTEWLSAFVVQALTWEGQLFQVRSEKPDVDCTCAKSTAMEDELSQYVSAAGPLSPTETPVERFVFDLSLNLLSLLSNLLRGVDSIHVPDSLPTFLVSVTMRLIDEFMSDLVDTDDAINLAHLDRRAEIFVQNNEIDNSLPVAELVLSAHAVLLLFLTCENNASRESYIVSLLPRRSWWLPVRLLKGFISLQGQAGVLLRDNLQLVLDCISKMTDKDTIRADDVAFLATKADSRSQCSNDDHLTEVNSLSLVVKSIVNSDTVQSVNVKAEAGSSYRLRSPPSGSLKVQDQEMRWVWDGSDFVWTSSIDGTGS